MDRIISCYTPFRVNNLYAENVKRLLKYQNIEAVEIKKCLTNPKLFLQCSIYNFNWFEKVDSNNKFKNVMMYFMKIALLKCLKLNNKKIVYTLHNKKPHDLNNEKYSLKMMEAMCKYADAIVGLCPETKDVIASFNEKYTSKFNLVLHPNYISNYNQTTNYSLRDKLNINESDLVFLFFGAVSPYKNIETLIDVFNSISNEKIKLLIAGNPKNLEYKNELIKRTNGNPNIIFDFRYIPDDEMVAFYNTADIIVLPYHKDSSLNSGAVYLSFSLKKTVVCPDIGTINALKNKDFVYHYDYENEEQHERKLKSTIAQVCHDFEKNSNILKQNGLTAYEYVNSYHSDAIISNQYRILYQKLLNK